MTSSQDWGPVRWIGFRFGIVFGALCLYPFPIYALPTLDGLADPRNTTRNTLRQIAAAEIFRQPARGRA
jgi:hypothetical protein